jgi:uncharacterized protein YdiU (UPF0061 family)
LAAARALFDDPAAFDAWASGWQARLASEAGSTTERSAIMRAANPAFIPRNHQVEKALAAAEAGDLAPLDSLIAVLAAPCDDQPKAADYALPPRPEEVVRQTFCGT